MAGSDKESGSAQVSKHASYSRARTTTMQYHPRAHFKLAHAQVRVRIWVPPRTQTRATLTSNTQGIMTGRNGANVDERPWCPGGERGSLMGKGTPTVGLTASVT